MIELLLDPGEADNREELGFVGEEAALGGEGKFAVEDKDTLDLGVEMSRRLASPVDLSGEHEL